MAMNPRKLFAILKYFTFHIVMIVWSFLKDNITCPKGFGLKLAKLGLKTPLKK